MASTTFPRDDLRLFYAAWRQIQGEEHDYLFDGTLEQICCVGFFSTEAKGRLDYWAKFPNDRVLIALSTLCRKFFLAKDQSRLSYVLGAIERWALANNLVELPKELQNVREQIENASAVEGGLRVAVGTGDGLAVASNLKDSLARFYYARLFHINDSKKLDEAEFLERLVGVSALEKANCYRALLIQVRAVAVIGDFVEAALTDETHAVVDGLGRSRGVQRRLRLPARSVALQLPPPDFSRREFPDVSSDVREVYSFVDARLSALFRPPS